MTSNNSYMGMSVGGPTLSYQTYVRTTTTRFYRRIPTSHKHHDEAVQDMFITPLYQQHTSHTLASRAYGPQPLTCGVNLPQDHTSTTRMQNRGLA